MTTLQRVRRVTAQRTRVDEEWREAIIRAVAEGETLRTVAEAAGVSHVRVHQIVRGR